MIIIEGIHGTYVGNQQRLIESNQLIKEAIEKCKNKKAQKEFIRNLKKDEAFRTKYSSAFELIYIINDFNEEQSLCYRKLKKYF